MLRLLALLLWLGSVATSSGQSNPDSLLTLLKTASAPTDKMTLYGKIAWALISESDLSRAGQYADSLNLTATGVRDSVGILKAHYYHGIIRRFTGDYAEALRYFNPYLRFHQARGDSSRVAGVLYQIGIVHSKYGNYEKSLAAYHRCLAIEEAAGNAYSVGYTLNAIGIIYKETKSFDQAIPHFKKALTIFDSLEALVDKTDVLVNLGNTYSSTQNFRVAIGYYQRAIEIDKQTGKEYGVALSLANIGFLFDKMGQYDSALAYHQKALLIREKLPDSEYLARSLIGVGLGYLRLREPRHAHPYLRRALKIVEENRSKPLLRDAHLHLSNMYEQMDDAREALLHFRQYELFKDSILNEQTAEKINELQIKHEVTDKERKIALLESEKQLQLNEARRQSGLKKALIAGFVLILILGGLILYSIRQRYQLMQKDNEIEEANLRHQLSDLKIQALRAQIDPHFLFNCLNSINRMIVKGDTENASMYLKKFSKLIRQIVENGQAIRVSLENELALIESYIQLEELRFKNKIGYEIHVDEKIEKGNTFLPPMILQPFVENSIWHGLTNKNPHEQGRIKIAVTEENENLLCMIEDNGIGRDQSRKTNTPIHGKTRSVGIGITEERLKLLTTDGIRDLIKITDLKDTFDTAIGTRVEIRIPLS